MILFWLTCLSVIIITIIARFTNRNELPYKRSENTFTVYFIGLMMSLMFLLLVNISSLSITARSENITYSQPIVSLNDGKGIEGSVTGGFFVMSAQIGDTQNFAYYRKNDNGSLSLDKRTAPQSTIWQDAAPETAHIDVTDRIWSCKPTWYAVLCTYNQNEFIHADFHIPPNSIKQSFELDAQ